MRQVGLHVPVELTNAAAERSLHFAAMARRCLFFAVYWNRTRSVGFVDSTWRFRHNKLQPTATYYYKPWKESTLKRIHLRRVSNQ